MRLRLQLATATAVFAAVVTAALAATAAQAGTTRAGAPAPVDTLSDIVTPSRTSPPPLDSSPWPPFPPTNLTVTNATGHSVTLSWTASRSGCCPVAGYRVLRYGQESNDPVWVGDVGNVTTATITADIQPAMTYRFAVVAYDVIGVHVSAPSNVVTAHTPSDLSTPSTPPPPSCRVTYANQAEWTGGFVAIITITNDASSTLADWVLTFTFGGDQKVSNAWGGTATQSGALVTVHSVPWNAAIPPHASVSLGMQGSWTTSDTSPRVFSLNDGSCTVG